MAAITPALDEITSEDICRGQKGVFEAYWAKYDDIDWAAMAADALDFDQTNCTILDYVMLNGATFKKLDFQRKSGLADFTYTEENGYYEVAFNSIYEGNSVSRRNSFQKAIGVCRIVLHLYYNNGSQRVVGVEWNGDKFSPPLEQVKITRHLESSGQTGGSEARDELDIAGEQVYSPLPASIPFASLPYVAPAVLGTSDVIGPTGGGDTVFADEVDSDVVFGTDSDSLDGNKAKAKATGKAATKKPGTTKS